jgi:mercuric ion binding protein
MMKHLFFAALLAALTPDALAAQQTVTLSVPGMSCAACPITVKKALEKVNGVTTVNVDFDKKQATVVFDDASASAATLTRATADAGYPSTVVPGAK